MQTDAFNMTTTTGLHHITAIAADPQRNVDFYEGFLGQRFVKRTVNFDDPRAYHLYYGDYLGSPGTAMTFFSWAGMPPRTPGVGEVCATYYRIPKAAHDYWLSRAAAFQVEVAETSLFGEVALHLRDPDGHELYLIASELADSPDLTMWADGLVVPESSLQGFYGVRITVQHQAMLERLLCDVFGYEIRGEQESVRRYSVPSALGQYIDVIEETSAVPARQGVGSVHHIALRAKDDADRELFRERLIELGLQPTGLIDRTFFHSTYCFTPAGVLFEIATDQPGFTVNEPAAELGEKLVLPEQYEHLRPQIEQHLPPITLPRHANK